MKTISGRSALDKPPQPESKMVRCPVRAIALWAQQHCDRSTKNSRESEEKLLVDRDRKAKV